MTPQEVFELEIKLIQDFRKFILEHHMRRPDLRSLCLKEATTLFLRYMSTGLDHYLVESIAYGRVGVVIYRTGHPTHARACAGLSSSLKTRYQFTGDRIDLLEAVCLARGALSLCPPGHESRALMCGHLAVTLHSQFELTNDHAILGEMIDLNRESLSLWPSDSPSFAKACGNLGSFLYVRYEVTRDMEVLNEAISLQQDCLRLWPQGQPDEGVCSTALAHSLRARYVNTGRESDLTEAIEHQRRVVLKWPKPHPHSAAFRHNLAFSLFLRYQKTGDGDLGAEAIDLAKQALALYPRGHPRHSAVCHGLRAMLKIRYEKTRDQLLLGDIEDLCKISLSSNCHPNTKWAIQADLAWVRLQSGSRCFDVVAAVQFLSTSLDHHPDNVWWASLRITRLLSVVWGAVDNQKQSLTSQHHRDLMKVYRRVIRLLSFLDNPTLAVKTQLHTLRLFRWVGRRAFVNAVLAEDWRSGLEDMEYAQGMLWSQRLRLRDPDLQLVPETLANRLTSGLQALANATSWTMEDFDMTPGLHDNSTSNVGSVQHNYATQVYALLQEIRSVPGLERFMLGETAASLCSVSSTHPVVLLVGLGKKTYAVILNQDARHHTLFPLHWNEQEFTKLADSKTSNRCTMSDIQDTCKGENLNGAMEKLDLSASTATNRRMRRLWEDLVKPVLDRLGIQPAKGRARPRLHWCPTGSFIELPLHAAGIYDGPTSSRISCADYVVSSYTPTLTSLLRVQKAVLPIPKESTSMVLVAERRSQELNLGEIPAVESEIQMAGTVAQAHSIGNIRQISGSTTVSGTCNAIQTANIVHLACHGIQHPVQATESGFCLGDGRLTISKLMELKMDNAFLAFLSACETARSDAKQPDQTMHLAAALLFTGFKSVVATIWAINDSDGPKIAKWFYEELFASDIMDADSVAFALDVAVGKLPESGVSLDRWAPFIHMGA